MKIKDIPFSHIPQFSSFDKAYVEHPEEFEQLYHRKAQLSSFEGQIKEKQDNYSFNRGVLADCIEQQYLNSDLLSKLAKQNIDLLRQDKTFTIITAHQPSLFTGPLYFIYKIVSAIQTASEVNGKYKDLNILPVFIIGGEDHDFEEINHFHYKEHKFEWKEQQGGAVGRMPVSEIQSVLRELKPHLDKTFYGKEIFELLKASYSEDRTLTQATQYFIARLFEDHPLLVVSMDEPSLKKAFVPFIKKEIFETVSEKLVKTAQDKLEGMGYSAQAHAREINFFYLENGSRSRIIFQNGEYRILESDRSYSKDALKEEIERRPERFSPNVIMRPVYQEFVFPNLAYVGGGGELAYWMERKKQFEAFGINFPVLLRRHSATLLNKNHTQKAMTFPWTWADWFKNRDVLVREFLKDQHSEQLSFSEYYNKLHGLFDQLGEEMAAIDPTLDYSAEAGRADSLKVLERLQTKVFRALKKKEEIQINRLDAVRSQMFPNGNLQERHDNFISYYEKHGPDLFKNLFEAFPAFDIQMKVITDL